MRRMAALLGAREVMRALAAALAHEADLPFACALVQALNLILLTAPEVSSERPTCVKVHAALRSRACQPAVRDQLPCLGYCP